jgi:Zn-dependent protease with chaperone function
MHQFGVTPPLVTPRMLEYVRLRYIFLFTGMLYTWLSLFVVLQTGLATKMRDWCARWSAGSPAATIRAIPIYVAMLTVVLAVLRLPYSWYVGFYVEHAFNLTHQGLLSWLGDFVKNQLVDWVGLAVVWVVAFFAYAKFPKRWPVVLWALMTPLIAFVIFVYPLVVDPLFNKYAPMPPSALHTSIEKLAGESGIANAPVFVVDKSRQTDKLNAEVTGLGSSARVVIWDTTLNKLPEDEVLAIIGHELGHYALGHVLIGFALSVIGLLAGLLIFGRLFEPLVKRFPKRWGAAIHLEMPSLQCIPALMLVFSILGFFGEPIDNGISRWIEHQADVFGLQITGNRAAMARTFVSLARENLSDPDPPPFIQFWFFSHPSLRERIDFALGINNK